MSRLTADLGGFLENIGYEQLPESVLPLVRNVFTDTVGVIMVGSTEPVVDIVRKTLVEPRGRRLAADKEEVACGRPLSTFQERA